MNLAIASYSFKETLFQISPAASTIYSMFIVGICSLTGAILAFIVTGL